MNKQQFERLLPTQVMGEFIERIYTNGDCATVSGLDILEKAQDYDAMIFEEVMGYFLLPERNRPDFERIRNMLMNAAYAKFHMYQENIEEELVNE